MKKIVLFALCAIAFSSCQKGVETPEPDEPEEWGYIDISKAKKFTFTVKGDFGAAAFTRAYLQADGKDMTDLWVFDYMNGQCIQKLHQTADDENWGAPQMSLPYGQHHVYFVASRGGEPSVNETDHIISWGTVRDTFWKDYAVSVVNTSNGNRAVTLDRVCTKVKLTVNDEVSASCASIEVTPSVWYYGLDYVTGEAVSAQTKTLSVDVPNSYVGTTGQLFVSVFGISGLDEWTTNVSVAAKDGSGNVIGSATINGAPFVRNRASEYSGNLFGSGGVLDVSLSQDWQTAHVGTW